MEQRNDLNRKLASLLGWTHFEAAGGALLGSPPWWAGNSRGQAQVPDWEGDWRHAGALMAEYGCVPCPHNDSIHGSLILVYREDSRLPDKVRVADFKTVDDAYRAAILTAVIAKLESRKG